MAKSIYEVVTGKESPRTRRVEAAARKTGSRIADDVRADPGVQAGVRAATGVRNQMRDRRRYQRVRTALPPEQKRQLRQGAAIGATGTAAAGLGGVAVAEGVRDSAKLRQRVARGGGSSAQKAGKTVRIVARKVPKGKAAGAAAAGAGAAYLARRATGRDRPYRDWYDGR